MNARQETVSAVCCITGRWWRRALKRGKGFVGIWQDWSWRQVARKVRSLACGLAAKGFKPARIRDQTAKPAEHILGRCWTRSAGRHPGADVPGAPPAPRSASC